MLAPKGTPSQATTARRQAGAQLLPAKCVVVPLAMRPRVSVIAGAAAALPFISSPRNPCVVTLDLEHEDARSFAELPGTPSALISWDSAPDMRDAEAWGRWMGNQLSRKLVGMMGRTSRAQVVTCGVQAASVVKGRIRAHDVDLVLQLEGTHLKTAGVTPVYGTIRVGLKTEEGKDKICMSEVQWDAKTAAAASPQVLADLAAAAESPLESALACRLNDLMWNVERHSLDQSLELDDDE